MAAEQVINLVDPATIDQAQSTDQSQNNLPTSCSNVPTIQEQGTTSVSSSSNAIEQPPQANQLSTNPRTFTCFRKLTIEIRLDIWRWSFPSGREVNFGNEFMFKNKCTNVERCIFQFEEVSPLPVALQVNQESRHETLKHYTVLFRGDSHYIEGKSKPIERPFCYNPKLDTAWINPIPLQPNYWTGTLRTDTDPWLTYLAAAAPSVFSNTRTLEIRGWYKIWPSTVLIFRNGSGATVIGQININDSSVPAGIQQSTPLHQYLDLDTQLQPLLQFRGLEELKLIPYDGRSEGSAYSSSAMQILNGRSPEPYLQGIKDFLEEHKDNFGGMIPVLTVKENEE